MPTKREKYHITTEIIGYDSDSVFNKECLYEIFMTLDVKIHDKYITLWDERLGSVHEMGEALWIQEIDGVKYIMGELDQIWYTDRLQTAYDTEDTMIPVTVRITRRDVLGEVIPALTTEFRLEVHDNGEISKCVD
jgi:hypothetical protein